LRKIVEILEKNALLSKNLPIATFVSFALVNTLILVKTAKVKTVCVATIEIRAKGGEKHLNPLNIFVLNVVKK
jgi:hypothetical protein